MADEPEDVIAEGQVADPEVAPDPEVAEETGDEAGDETVEEGVESTEPGEEPEPEADPLIEGSVSALNVQQTLAMGQALEAFRFFNHTVARSAIGATVREVVVEVHGEPWCRLKVNRAGVAYVEPLMAVTGSPEEVG